MNVYVVRGKTGAGLAELVSRDGVTAVIRRLIGSRFRKKTHQSARPVVVPASDVIREASEREISLGFPV